jgi:hypothetical protein
MGFAVRNDRGDRGNVGIIRSPIRASILPDHMRHTASRSLEHLVAKASSLGRTVRPSLRAVLRRALVPLIQSDVHHVQANLPAATTTTHPMRNRKIETAKSACFLNFLRPSLIRVVRRKKTERTKRKIGIAAATKAIILKIIVHCQFCGLAAPPHVRCRHSKIFEMMPPVIPT